MISKDKIITYHKGTGGEKRRRCEAEGCGRGGRNKGFKYGHTVYGRVCEYHHRFERSTNWLSTYKKRKAIENKVCQNCGWNKTDCDRHRIESKQGYTRENVAVLCPNCHRLAHRGLLTLVPFSSKCIKNDEATTS